MAYDPDVLASLREQNPGVADDIILAALDMQSQQDTMPVRPDLSRESSMRNYVGDTRNDTDIIESDGVVSPTTHQVPTFMELTGGGGSRPSNKRSDSDRVPTFMELTSGMSTEPTSTPAANPGDGNFTRGAKTAIGQTVPLAKGLVGAIGATGEQAFGEGGIWSGLKDWGIKGYQDGMAKLQPLARENDDITVAWEKAKSGDLGALMDWAAYGLGYGAVQLGESALTGGIGALAAKGGAGILAKTAVENMVAKQAAKISAKQSAKIATGELTEAAIAKMATTQVANRIAAMGAGTALQGYNEMMEVGSIFPDAVEEANKHGGMTGEDLARVWGWGTLAAATESATDLLGLGAITGKIKLPGAGGRIARGVTGSMIGGVTEGAQEGVQTWMEWKGANKDTDSEAFWKDFINSAAMGALPGHVVGGVAGAVHVPKPADILNTPNTQQAIDTFNAAVQADATASEDVRAIGALMQDYTAANRQTLEAAQAQLDAEVDQGDPLAVANPADVTNAAALARTTQADQKIAATLSDEEQGIGIPPAAADTNNLPDTSAPITGQRSLAQQVLEISRNGGPKSEAERGLMAMARRDLGEQKVAEIERLGQAPALMTRMEQKGVEHGATPPITIVPNDNGVPIIRSQTPEISTAVNAELKSAGINTHTIDGTSIRVPKAQGQVAQQIVSRVNTRFTQPRQEQTLGTQAEETVPTEQGQPESQPAAPLTLGNANHAQSATVRAMLGDQVSAEDHVGVIDNLDTLPTQVDANQGPRIGRPMAKAIKTLAGMLGRKVVFYETTNKEVAEGINRDGNTLYVNIDSNVDAIAVAGHEMVHSLEHEQPDLYEQLLDATKALLKSGGRDRAVAYAKYAGARNLDSAARELLSDIGGNEWRSGQFWSDVFDEVHRTHAPTEARSIITKIRDAVVAFINKLIRATPKQGFQHGYTREELAEIRDNLVKATAESFRRAERVRLGLAPTPEAKAGEVRFAGKREKDADNEPTRVFVEVAPDPNNSALTEAWRSQPYDERVAMSRSIFQKILPKVLSALGIKGEFSEQLGGYKLDTNPSFATLFDNANDAHRFSLLAGYALSQDSMMVLSGQKFDGAMDAGIIQINLPGSATQEQVHQVYLAARGTWPGKISGHTTKNGIMHIVVPRKTALQVAMKVNKALGNKYEVKYGEGYYSFPQKEDYDYASEQGILSGKLPSTREDASELRAEASRLIQSELAKRGVRFSNQRQAPDAASGGLDGRVPEGEIEQSRPDGASGQGAGGGRAATDQGSKPGSISGLGVHYSANQRKTLVSSFFGSGLKGAELERVKSASDDRIKHRIYFYLNTGRGINPEVGVGSHAHTLKLDNIYDMTADQLDLRVGRDLSEFESALIDAGYDGYMTQESGIAVLLGQRVVTPDYIGSGIKPAVPLAGRAEPSAYGKAQQALADRHDLPSGQMKGKEWQKALPEMDLSHLDQDAYYYKDALLERPRFSAQRLSLEPGGGGSGKSESRPRIIGDSGRQYTNEQKDLFKHVGREVDEKTTLEKLKSWIWKNWVQGLFDQFAPVKNLSSHAYTLMRLSKGSTGAFEAFLHHGKLSIRDGAFDADTSGGAIESVFVPVGKEATDLLYWIAGNRAEKLFGEDREHLFSPDDIAAAKSLATGQTDFDYTLPNGTVTRNRALIYRDTLRKFNEFNKNILDMAEQSGLIDGASRHLWEHEFYVPFYRVTDEKGGGIRGMNIKQGVIRQQAFKQLKGGTEGLNDLLANTLMNWAHLIDASAKNRAAKATIDAAVNLGAARKAVAGEKNVVWYSDKGRKAEFVVDDPGLLVALNGLEYAGLRGPAMDALSATKHWLTMGVTASPFFKVRNLIRDSIQSIAVSDLSYNPLHNVKEGWKLTNRASQEYVSALAGGGLIRFGTMLEGSEAARTRQLIKQGSKDSHILDGEGKLKAFYDKVIEPAWSKYQELGNRGEEINRMALYDKLIAEGKTHAEAALAARDLMDFSMSGAFTSVRFLTQVVPFLNARLQGLYKLGKGAKEDKARFAIVMATTALAGLAMMGYASGDDDRWKRWKKREQWDKDNYWMFSFGDVDYRIPKPFEIGAMATLVERGFETAFMLGDEKNKWSKFGYAVLKIASDQLSMNPVPQLVKPILDIYANKDSFSGRPIETMSMERLKKDYRFNAGTSMFARGASTAGNTIADVAGMEFLSPVQIDHLVRSYFGWVGAAAVASADFAIRPMTNEPSRPEKDMLKWMSGGMVTDKDSAGSRYVSHLYDQLGELESAYGTWQQLRKEGKADDAREFAADHRDELRQYRQSENVKQRLSEMNKQIRMIERSDRHPAEKRILINRIRARQSDMAERLN